MAEEVKFIRSIEIPADFIIQDDSSPESSDNKVGNGILKQVKAGEDSVFVIE